MAELKDLVKHAEDAQGQAGAISEYFETEEKWLIRFEADLKSNPRRSKNDIRSAIRVIRRNLGRTERVLNRDDIEQDIADLSTHLPARLRVKLEELNKPLHVALAGFVAELSRSQGELRKHFEELETMAGVFESEQDAQRKTVELAQLVQKANAILAEIRTSLRWVRSFTACVGHYLEFLKFLEEL